MAALGVVTEKLRLYRHFVNGVLLITFVLACTIPVGGKELYEFQAVTKVDGLPPAPSRERCFADNARSRSYHSHRWQGALRVPGGNQG